MAARARFAREKGSNVVGRPGLEPGTYGLKGPSPYGGQRGDIATERSHSGVLKNGPWDTGGTAPTSVRALSAFALCIALLGCDSGAEQESVSLGWPSEVRPARQPMTPARVLSWCERNQAFIRFFPEGDVLVEVRVATTPFRRYGKSLRAAVTSLRADIAKRGHRGRVA